MRNRTELEKVKHKEEQKEPVPTRPDTGIEPKIGKF